MRRLGMSLSRTLLVLASSLALADTVWVGKFEAADAGLPVPWQIERLDMKIPPTIYHIRVWDGVNAVEAHAVKSMALLARPVDIDLGRTPVLCWRWRIDAPVKSADMTRKSGDDYAALNYIWDNSHRVGTAQDNAYTDRARMLVLRSGSENAGHWIQERRNVLKDFQQAFDGVSGQLRGLAIATDTDNTGEEAHAGFADFRFVSTDTECPDP